ncbi:MAG: hypothetical protein ACOC41_06895 [Chitinivibrionales bacterium]
MSDTEFRAKLRNLSSADFDGHTNFHRLSGEQKLMWLSQTARFWHQSRKFRIALSESSSSEKPLPFPKANDIENIIGKNRELFKEIVKQNPDFEGGILPQSAE